MKLLTKSVENAIHFILCIQDSCDKHRKCIEDIWLQEYSSFVSEWKQNQEELKKQADQCEKNLAKASKCVPVCPMEDIDVLEELALADSLLKKAKSIRIKNQKIINGIVDCKSISASSSESNFLSKRSAISSQASEKNKMNRRMPLSKSDLAIKANSHKSVLVPRSKSATAPLVPKSDTKLCHKSKNGAALSAKYVTANQPKFLEKTTDVPTSVSSKDLDKFKRLHIKPPAFHEFQSNKTTSISDSSEDKNQQQMLPYPSSRDFFNVIKGRLNIVSSHFKLKLWYPFLSSKCEVFLTTVKINTLCSVKRTYNILYSIQEIMLWIDLLYLMEREINPTLSFDTNDVNMLRICSYLLSIFHPTSQRIPIIDPNG